MPELTNADVTRALKLTAQTVSQDPRYSGTSELAIMNQKLLGALDHTDRGDRRSRRITEGTRRSARRTKRYYRRTGGVWEQLTFEKLLVWLKENWASILRLLMSLLIFFI